MPKDLTYVAPLFAPRALQRIRLRPAIRGFLLGAATSAEGLLTQDPTLSVIATVGIVAMFLTAGLEVNGAELKEGATVIAQQVVVRLQLTLGIGALIATTMSFSYRVGTLITLPIFTPSTGFAPEALGLQPRERLWVRSQANAPGLLAPGV